MGLNLPLVTSKGPLREDCKQAFQRDLCRGSWPYAVGHRPLLTFPLAEHVNGVKQTIKGAMYGIEPSTRNGNILPIREEAVPSVPKNILLTFESNTPLFSNLLQMFPQLHCPWSPLKAMS